MPTLQSQPLSVHQARLRFRDVVWTKFFVRFHTSLILMSVVASGVVANRLLYRAGLLDMRVRYPVALIASYAVFFGLARLWVAYVVASLESEREALAEGMGRTRFLSVPVRSRLSSSTTSAAGHVMEGAAEVFSGTFVEELFSFVILAALSVSVFYLVTETPMVLMESAFQLALSSGLLRRTRVLGLAGYAPDSSPTRTLLSETIVSLLIVLVCSVGVAFLLHEHAPEATKLSEVFWPVVRG
jgi:hypothetical protein